MNGRGDDDWGDGRDHEKEAYGSPSHEQMDDPYWREGDLFASQLRGGQGLAPAFLAGAVAAVVGVGAWVLVTSQTGGIFSPMALVIGYLVGFAVRWVGKGTSPSFGIVASILTAIGSLAGLLLSVVVILAARQEVPLDEMVERLDPEAMMQVLGQMASPLTIVVFLFAVYESYRVAIVTQQPVTAPSEKTSEVDESRREP